MGVELVQRTAIEREYLYPAVIEHVPGGSQWAARGLAEHAGIEEIVRALQGPAPDQEVFGRLVLDLVTRLTDHLRE